MFSSSATEPKGLAGTGQSAGGDVESGLGVEFPELGADGPPPNLKPALSPPKPVEVRGRGCSGESDRGGLGVAGKANLPPVHGCFSFDVVMGSEETPCSLLSWRVVSSSSARRLAIVSSHRFRDASN